MNDRMADSAPIAASLLRKLATHRNAPQVIGQTPTGGWLAENEAPMCLELTQEEAEMWASLQERG